MTQIVITVEQNFQKLTFKASGQTKQSSRVVAEMKRGRIEPETEEIWSNVTFPVPSLPATNLAYCSLIDVQYFLEVIFRYTAAGLQKKNI